jgi:general stress protein YciG
MKINYHTHHLVPKHAGGTDDPSNLVRVNVAMHAFLHKLRYKETGDTWDKIAYEALEGQITHAEATSQARQEFRRQNPEHHSNAGKKGGKAPATDRTKEVAAETAQQLGQRPWWNNGLNNKRSYTCPGEGYVPGKLPHGKHKRTYTQCPHCGMSCNLSNLSRHILSKHS